MMMLTYLFIVIVLLLLLHFKNYLRAVYLAFRIPGPPDALPFLGHAFLITDNKKLQNIGNTGYKIYGPIIKCWVSIVPFFIITEPKHLQIILGSNKYSTKNIFYSLLHNFLGAGLITATGERWKRHRRLVQPFFHVNVLKIYFSTFYKYSENMVRDLKNKTDVNIVTFANKFVLDVLHDTVLGISERDDSDPFRKGKISIMYRVTRPWLLFDAFFKFTSAWKSESKQQEFLQDYTKCVLRNKQKNINDHRKTTTSNLMEMLIDVSSNNPEFTEDDIINETCTFMLAGQDSVAAALAFCLYFLAVHQDIQARVVEEINKIGIDTFEDIIEMKYLEQCIKETMRLCPSVPMMAREITKDVTIGKYNFPAGTNIFISPFITHRLPHIYQDPMKFSPERFSPENLDKMHPYAYIPFSAGPRNCIGYKFALVELKTVISQILRNYRVSLSPGFELNLSYRVTLRAKGGIWLKFNDRNVSKV